MANTPPTAAQFKALLPKFAAVPDATVDAYIALAAMIVDDEWPAFNYTLAITSYACHLLTIAGFGTGQESEDNASGLSAFQTIKSADLTLTRFAKAASGSSYIDWLNSTTCGQQFAIYLQQGRGGPRIISGAVVPGYGGYRDSILYGLEWPGVFA
jgi:hypothetical protein